MNTKEKILVVGAGPAGLAAAVEAVAHGAGVMLVDENTAPGGQLLKQTHKFFGSEQHHAGVRGIDIAKKFLARAGKINILLNTPVVGIYKDRVAMVEDNKAMRTASPERLILATGAAENTLNFPGWTLPGVMTAGAAQTFVNLHRIRIGNRAVIIGSGNVGLIVAYQLRQAGIDVAAIIEAMPQIGGWGVHAAKVRRIGIPILTRHTIKEVRGQERVAEVVITGIDGRFQPVAGTERSLKADTVLLAVGMSPRLQLLSMLRTGFKWVADKGGWLPRFKPGMATESRHDLFVAGDLAGIEEASTAIEEGKIAGLSAAYSLGCIDRGVYEERLAVYRSALKQLRSGLIQGPITKAVGLKRTGVPSRKEMEGCPGIPAPALLNKGPLAIVECYEEIPCNPCEVRCPHKAITVGRNIIARPVLDAEKCVGCRLCIPSCPGQAIFVVDTTKEDHDLVSIPYEFYPLPRQGDKGAGIDRNGAVVCQAEVVQVQAGPKNDRTAVVTLSVPRGRGMVVRFYTRREAFADVQ